MKKIKMNKIRSKNLLFNRFNVSPNLKLNSIPDDFNLNKNSQNIRVPQTRNPIFHKAPIKLKTTTNFRSASHHNLAFFNSDGLRLAHDTLDYAGNLIQVKSYDKDNITNSYRYGYENNKSEIEGNYERDEEIDPIHIGTEDNFNYVNMLELSKSKTNIKEKFKSSSLSNSFTAQNKKNNILRHFTIAGGLNGEKLLQSENLDYSEKKYFKNYASIKNSKNFKSLNKSNNKEKEFLTKNLKHTNINTLNYMNLIHSTERTNLLTTTIDKINWKFNPMLFKTGLHKQLVRRLSKTPKHTRILNISPRMNVNSVFNNTKKIGDNFKKLSNIYKTGNLCKTQILNIKQNPDVKKKEVNLKQNNNNSNIEAKQICYRNNLPNMETPNYMTPPGVSENYDPIFLSSHSPILSAKEYQNDFNQNIINQDKNISDKKGNENFQPKIIQSSSNKNVVYFNATQNINNNYKEFVKNKLKTAIVISHAGKINSNKMSLSKPCSKFQNNFASLSGTNIHSNKKTTNNSYSKINDDNLLIKKKVIQKDNLIHYSNNINNCSQSSSKKPNKSIEKKILENIENTNKLSINDLISFKNIKDNNCLRINSNTRAKIIYNSNCLVNQKMSRENFLKSKFVI